MILVECTPHVALLRLRAQSERMEGTRRWPGEDGEPIEAAKRRCDIGGNIDQPHIVQAHVLCPLQPFMSRCDIRDSPAGRRRRRASAKTSRLSGAWHRLSMAQTTSKLASEKAVWV